MLNLKHYRSRKTSEVYDEILSNRKNDEFIVALKSIDTKLKKQFEIFAQHFTLNSLELITALEVEESIREKLFQLYAYKSRVIQAIRSEVITGGRERAVAECQYCTINSMGSMDHIMPKKLYPEYSVNAHNLFPCCTQCNSYKSETWLKGGQRQFLNLYIDILPTTQYLFVDIKFLDGVISPFFYLQNKSAIDDHLFCLLTKHYENMHLLLRFSEASHTIISVLVSTLRALPASMSYAEVADFVRKDASFQNKYFGNNYWKNVLRVALVENHDFLKYCRGEDNQPVGNPI